ncbi:uncharacterized protein N7459_004723 [Penicillium hispanicum]|uniref:uncharacterized protein n=1 Tax=Penicillium hispanicum TaxID=1080232 RepID=UPI002540CB65|nr:uncharacterized protein N7459_004723 [Penicillium hispanicum]KAJ5584923.1 hypothetical protein N7459_004723 [Penicillium hispanicum]
MSQPWLDSLSDDWPSMPSAPSVPSVHSIPSGPASPTTPGPPKSLQSSPRRSVQNSPSRIPVPARRSVEQQSSADKRKVTRPCHFIRRQPPTPKTPRTPKTPSKLRSPTPAKSTPKSPKSPRSPKPIPKIAKSTPKSSAKPIPSAAGKQPSAMDTRSPLRSVSNVSSQSGYQSTDTVQIKPKKGQEEDAATPEWRRRLVRGEIPTGEQRDLFAPMGLESVFKPPTPGSATGQQDSIAFTKQDDALWDFTDATSRPESVLRGNEDDAHGHESERAEDDLSGIGIESPFGTVNRAPWADKRPRHRDLTQDELSQIEHTGIRTASGLEDLRNEGITPITFTRPNTLDGNGTSEVIKSALKQVTNKLESLSVDTGSRPDSPASDSFLFYNHSEPRLDRSPQDDSLLDVTSHSLPQDLSMGTIDFNRRGAYRPFHHKFSPSPFPSHRMSPATLANAKIRSSPLFNRSQTNASPALPRPSSSHVRPSTAGDVESKGGTMPSSGSPLKLFGEHDTFTNNRLLRRMSQFEETFGDGSDGDEPPSPSEEARRKGESRSFLNVRHEPLSELSLRRNDPLSSRNANRPRMNRFGDGELDKFDFSDNSSYEHKLVYDEAHGFGSRPSSRKMSSGRQKYLRRGSQQESVRYARSASSGFTRKPSAWTRQSYFDYLRDGTWSSRLNKKENVGFPETKRVPKAALDPTPKRRRTILRDDSAEPEQSHANDDPAAAKLADSMSLLQRSLLQHGVQLENGEYLAPPALSQSMQRPRTPTPSQLRSAQGTMIAPSRDYSESNFDERDYSDSFSLEGDIPLVKITGASDSSRKGSITTQDYLKEATKVMDLIRAKGPPADVMARVEEFDAESEDGDFSYEDESTREAFSRPPSRDGTDLRKMREPKELNPQILDYLKKYQEREDGDFDTNESVTSLNMASGRGSARVENQRPQQLFPEQRKRKTSSSVDDIAADIAQDLMTINTQMSGFSVSSVPTGSSQNSQAKGMISSDLVSHLIPEQVNGLKYDRSKNQWVAGSGKQPAPQSSPGEEHDPFYDIPDLSVDELQEMMRVHGLSSPAKSLPGEQPADPHTRTSSSTGASPTKSDRPHTRDGEPSVNASSLKSGNTQFTLSVPNSGTRATSWGTDENREQKHNEERPSENRSAMASQPPRRQTRVATITFSSPLVSHVGYRDDPEHSDLQSESDESNHPEAHKDATPAGTDDTANSKRPLVPPAGRETSVAGRPFIRRPISRIEERNEEGGEDLSLIRRTGSLAVERTPGENEVDHSLVPVQTAEQETSYSFHLSPLPEFSVNQPDHQLNLEMSYVAQRTHPASLRQVHGTFALATEDLIKHITDVEPYEPYWEHVRRLVLRHKGLITLHKLSEFCPRLEDLDVSDNDIGQLSGVPETLRTLKIPRNCLSNLTPWSHLTNLQYLDISGNDIETLDGFSGLIHLRELKANDNQIRNIDGVLDLNGLLSMKLSNNSVTAVDFEGSELTRLRDLDLSHNCLTSVRNIEWLPSLASLDLSANQITKFNASSSLISLRALKLSGNRIDEFDVKNFSSVSLLYLDHNSLSTISGLEQCHNLEVLSLREQTRSSGLDGDATLDIDLGFVKDIRKVFLSSNKLSPRCLSPSASLLRLQFLDIAACTLPSLPSEFASSFPNLKVLNMNFNSVAELEPLVGMNCLARLMVVSNRLARMRRVCQILSRLGRTGKATPCSLRKLDLRGNPLTVGFYPPALTGNGLKADRKRLKGQEKAIIQQRESRRELSYALADLTQNGPVAHAVSWEDGAHTDHDVEIDDPFTIPPADLQADQKYLAHLDKATRLRRRVLELLLYAGTSGSLHTLDGLELRPSLGDDCPDMGQAWTKLEELGVLRRKAITSKA